MYNSNSSFFKYSFKNKRYIVIFIDQSDLYISNSFNTVKENIPEGNKYVVFFKLRYDHHQKKRLVYNIIVYMIKR